MTEVVFNMTTMIFGDIAFFILAFPARITTGNYI